MELVRLNGEEASSSIEWIQWAPVYRLRGQLLPLVYLNGILSGRCFSQKKSEVVNRFVDIVETETELEIDLRFKRRDVRFINHTRPCHGLRQFISGH
jgi:hypothetical protein